MTEHQPPGPGTWTLGAQHIDRPFTHFLSDFYHRQYERGFRDAFAQYGVTLDTIAMGYVGGFFYTQPRPLGAPPGASGPPPKIVFKLLTWLHPAMRRRVAAADEAWAGKIWRHERDAFRGEVLPARIAANRAVQAVGPAALSDDALRRHVRDAQALFSTAAYHHHRLACAMSVPVGHFLVRVAEWTGRRSSEVLPLMRGASESSRHAFHQCGALVELLEQHDDAAARLDADREPGAIIEDLAAHETVGEAMRAYLDVVGHQVMTEFDLPGLTGHESPGLLVKALRETVAGRQRSQIDRVAEQTASIRDQVPSTDRATFDELLEEARSVYGLRDDRCNLNDQWALGLLKRALVELGRRLPLHDPAHAFELNIEQLERLADGADDSLAALAEERATYRETVRVSDMPERLGPPPSPPPPADWFKGGAAKIHAAIGAYMQAMFEEPEANSSATSVAGLPASGGVYIGTARLVLDGSDFDRVEPGDVLIARVTTPTYNVLLPLLGAVVTDRGGLLAHPAIVAREYGIPGVVGTRDATTTFPDGSRVEVDGDKGVVTLLS